MDPAARFSIGDLHYGDLVLLKHGAFIGSPRVFDKYEVFLLDLVRKPGPRLLTTATLGMIGSAPLTAGNVLRSTSCPGSPPAPPPRGKNIS
jgi:hypothetical protein